MEWPNDWQQFAGGHLAVDERLGGEVVRFRQGQLGGIEIDKEGRLHLHYLSMSELQDGVWRGIEGEGRLSIRLADCELVPSSNGVRVRFRTRLRDHSPGADLTQGGVPLLVTLMSEADPCYVREI
jgi:hypothetical protein